MAQNKFSNRIINARNEGYDAGKNGKARGACPYPTKASPMAGAWLSGYQIAEDERMPGKPGATIIEQARAEEVNDVIDLMEREDGSP